MIPIITLPLLNILSEVLTPDIRQPFPWLADIISQSTRLFHGDVVGSSGLEPPTSRLSGARSNRLSYEPV